MTPVTFPLLKLPLLTFKHVVRSMKMEELFDLSHCSKKTQWYLKACYGKRLHFCVQISGDTHFSFYIKNQYDDTFYLCLENTFFGLNENKKFNYNQPNRTIQLSPSQTPLEGVMSIISHFFDSFDLEIGELFIDLDSVGIQFRPIIQSILKRQTVFNAVSIFGPIERENLNYLLETCPSQTPLEGVMSIISHFFDSFDLEIGELFIDLDCVQNQFRILFQSILERQPVFKDFHISGSIDREDLNYVLRNCTIQDRFLTDIKVKSPHNLNLNTKLINFDSAGWLTAPNLLSMGFETAELKKASFQLNDWVAILSAWRNGWNPKMYHLSITGDLEYQSIVNHLSFGTIREKSVVRLAKFYSIEDWCASDVEGGYDITRDDGKVATVYSFEDPPKYIEIHVWDNQATIN